jgi:hypothetical protein
LLLPLQLFFLFGLLCAVSFGTFKSVIQFAGHHLPPVFAVAGYRIGERATDLIEPRGFPETAAIFRSCASM